MEQTALRPKPIPGHAPGDLAPRPVPHAHAARRRGRRLRTVLFGTFVSVVLVLAGVGLGTVGATVIGMSRLAEIQRTGGAGAGAAQVLGAAVAGTVKAGGPGEPAAPGETRGSEESGAAGEENLTGAAGRAGKSASVPSGAAVPARATLGVEAVDADARGAAGSTGADGSGRASGGDGHGALVIGVHTPGPAHTAGLVRGDVVLAAGARHVGSAADLARIVADARPGKEVVLTVRHANGTRQQLTAILGVVT